MDMVNDGKDTRLDTPQAVKEALASGKDLYNPETGEFWWKYNDTGSIANTYIHLDDPNLLAVIDNPDFDLFEDIVGWLNYTGRIADSPDYYAENADDYPDAPDYDERDAVFAQIASEDGWVVATPENVRAAVQSHMAEHGGATYEDSRKVDDLLDSHGDKPISDFRKQPQGMSLKQAVLESRAASDRLSAKNGGTDDHDGKDER